MLRPDRHTAVRAVLGVLLLWVLSVPVPAAASTPPVSSPALPSGPPAAVETPSPGDFEAEREALGRRLRTDRVVLRPSDPGLVAYLQTVVQETVGGFFSWFSGQASELGPWVRAVVVYGTRILVVVLLVATAVLIWKRRPRAVPPIRADGPAEPRAVAPSTSLASRREAVEARLRSGDAVGALEALWWWWALRLGARDVDPSWTTRELLGAAKRRDLRALGRRFDFLAYGTEPGVEEVRSLWQEVQGAFGPEEVPS